MDVIRGVVAVDAPLPGRMQLPDNDPIKRLAVFSFATEQSKVRDRIDKTVAALQERKFPVSAQTMDGKRNRLNEADRTALLRWIDALDKL